MRKGALLSQTKVVDYTVKWLEKHGWEILFAHYPEGHHISPKYGRLKVVIGRKIVDIIARKGKCLFLIQCNKQFKISYLKKLKEIKRDEIKGINFDVLLKGISFHIPLHIKEKTKVLLEGFVLFEVKSENLIQIYGSIPMECEDDSREGKTNNTDGT